MNPGHCTISLALLWTLEAAPKPPKAQAGLIVRVVCFLSGLAKEL